MTSAASMAKMATAAVSSANDKARREIPEFVMRLTFAGDCFTTGESWSVDGCHQRPFT
jgi:hypothetical protein